MPVERAVFIDAFMDAEELAVFLGNERVSAVGAEEANGGSDLFTSHESSPADLALKLSTAAIIVVDIVVWCPADRAESIFWNRGTIAALNRFDRFLVLPEIVIEEELPVLFGKLFDDRKPINLVLLVLGTVDLVVGPLFQWNISGDKKNKLANLLILFLNNSE